MSYIFISKDVLQENGWHIQRMADLYDKVGRSKFKPSIVGFCPECKLQHVLIYQRQTKDDFVFSCLNCSWRV